MRQSGMAANSPQIPKAGQLSESGTSGLTLYIGPKPVNIMLDQQKVLYHLSKSFYFDI